MKQAHLYKLKRPRSAHALLLSAAVSCCLLAAFALALHTARTRSFTEETTQLETAIRRACVTCYAIEGRYPPSLDYIQDNYGVIVDTDTYAVRYDAFSENLLPDITVTRRKGVSA